MKNTPSFSIVIPTFNEEKYLPLLLDSIKMQSIQPKEIVVADRKGFDRTREIAREYNCKVVDGGIVSYARNNGYKHTDTEYVLFMDADITLPHKDTLIESFIFFERHKLDYSNSFYYNSKENITFMARVTIWGHNLRSVLNYITVRLFRLNTGGSGAMIITKRSLLDNIGGFSESLEMNEDSEIINRLLKKGYKFGYIPSPVRLSGRRFKDYGFRKAITIVLLLFTLDFLRTFGLKSRRIYGKYMQIKGLMGGE